MCQYEKVFLPASHDRHFLIMYISVPGVELDVVWWSKLNVNQIENGVQLADIKVVYISVTKCDLSPTLKMWCVYLTV